MIRKLLPWAALAYGIYSVFKVQGDFEHITRLALYVVFMAPAFVILALAPTLLERLHPETRLYRYREWILSLNVMATQTLTQYILMFCLPFFIMKENWFYFGLHLALLGSTLWDPLYEKLLRYPSYRHSLQAWALLSAFSFLFPFVLPGLLDYFYWFLALIVLIAFLPTHRERRYLFSQMILASIAIACILLPQRRHRFPLLSVWLKQPHLAWDENDKHTFEQDLPALQSWEDFQSQLQSGKSVCCVAPVVAPAALRERLTQEWYLGSKLIQRAHLPTPIQGNGKHAAFQSFFCKKNFEVITQDETLHCRVYLQSSIYLGGAHGELTVDRLPE